MSVPEHERDDRGADGGLDRVDERVADAGSPNAWPNQSRVSPLIGQVATRLSLNEYRTMIPIGM